LTPWTATIPPPPEIQLGGRYGSSPWARSRPEAGRHTAACIPGADLKIIDGWGHNMPVAAVPVIAGAMTAFIGEVERERAEAFSRPATPGCCGRQ